MVEQPTPIKPVKNRPKTLAAKIWLIILSLLMTAGFSFIMLLITPTTEEAREFIIYYLLATVLLVAVVTSTYWLISSLMRMFSRDKQ